MEHCKRLCGIEDTKEYIDKGFSGKNTDRPEFLKMVEDIKAGIISKVVCYKLDRVSRSILDFNNLLVIFKKYNVEFASCTENLDTNTPMGRAMTNIIATFAQLERETIQQRVKDNYYSRGKRGFYMGGKPPYGWKKEDIVVDGKKTSKLVADSDMCIVEKVFQLYANTSMSLGEIADYLNKLNVKTQENKAWESGKISRILKSSTYVKADVDIYNYYKSKGCAITNSIDEFVGENGCFIYGKRDRGEGRYKNVENHFLSIGLHKGYIDSYTFLKCQKKLEENKQLCRSGSGKHTWLTGLSKCGYCGYAVSVVRNNVGYRYFNCRGKTNLRVCAGHSEPLIVDDIESIVSKKIIEKIDTLAETKLEIINKNDSAINSCKIKIEKIEKQIEKLVEKLLESNDVAMKYINNKIEELDKEKSDLINEISELRFSTSSNRDIDAIIERAKDFYSLSFNEKKDIAKALINRVDITDEAIKISWKI